ncbi:DUF3581 family protein [Psychrobium sp. 1_MG-2023]|uniref:DUF3581 family protein n=1 Tax=Psychrobium sp. 1_MG-2023 TaxID=3062624 RepID=UPI000C349386|nr:DUF3581 family protein [Psychrobium sp. 1_MG-2023]MDP2561270.1 DUF3581 family protein [Psychrobium sp. 1_MG-2023]PKF55230.1 DUF3581 domain-containing protein [Alteromonadales bacterium alter-6D02]
MNINEFYSSTPAIDNGFCFTREQASHFAKDIAGDFNPLHDIETKKFCVPGDLLFSIALAKLGVSKKMQFTFSGMVTEGVNLGFSCQEADEISVVDENDKEYLSISRSGELNKESELASSLAEQYVAFSGHTFPHILVPLMEQENAMINPARPLVIYESMSIDLERLDFVNPTLEITETKLEVNGKRGRATLQFCFKVGDEVVGHGEKKMALSGLREFDAAVINDVVVDYDKRKQAYSA